MHHQVRLRGANTALDGEPKVSRPRHPVLSRKHLSRPCSNRAESRSERAAALAAPARHDGPTRARTHPQPKTVHTRTTSVVGLESPLALGHGYYSSMKVAPAPFGTRTLVSFWKQPRYLILRSSRSLAPARKTRHPSRSRIATFGRLFEGTDEISLGQTCFSPSFIHHSFHTRHRPARLPWGRSANVAELLALGNKTVNFCQGHLRPRRR